MGQGRFEALDGTAIVLRDKADTTLPAGLGTASMLRETVYGVADEATLEAIEAELRRDREVSRRDGVVRAADDMGFALAFQVSVRRPIALPAETVNAPGAAPQRGPECPGPAGRDAGPAALCCRMWCISCRTPPKPRPSMRGWVLSAPTASWAWAPSCGRPARWTTTPCS